MDSNSASKILSPGTSGQHFVFMHCMCLLCRVNVVYVGFHTEFKLVPVLRALRRFIDDNPVHEYIFSNC